jgi:hypothetical protein
MKRDVAERRRVTIDVEGPHAAGVACGMTARSRALPKLLFEELREIRRCCSLKLVSDTGWLPMGLASFSKSSDKQTTAERDTVCAKGKSDLV